MLASDIPVAPPRFHGGPPFPRDPRNAGEWNQFWREVFRSNCQLDYLRLDTCDDRYVDFLAYLHFDEPPPVLFAGNGISLLPRIFAHMGCRSLAVDIAPNAIEFAAQDDLTERHLHYFFGQGPFPVFLHEEVTRATAQAHREGGSVEFVLGDLFSAGSGKDVFQMAVMQNLMEHFEREDQRTLARHLFDAVAPGGILIAESQRHIGLIHTDVEFRGIEEPLEEAGFLIFMKEALRWKCEQMREWRARVRERQRPIPWWSRLRPKVIWTVEMEADSQWLREIQREFQRMAAECQRQDLERRRSGCKMVILQASR